MHHKRLTEKGYDLERGIKGSDNEHIKIKEYKRMTRKINQELNVKNDKLDKAVNDLEDKMKAVIKESKKVKEMQPKLQTIFNKINSYANSYKS